MMKEKSYKIEGMTCEHCVRAIEKELAMLDIDYYEVEIGLAKVKYDISKVKDEQIFEAINEAGYSVKE